MRLSTGILGLVTLAAPAIALAQQQPSTPPPLREDIGSVSKGARIDSVSRDANARFDPTRDTVKSMQTYVHLLKYGDCLSRISHSGAVKALALNPYSASERRQTALLGERATTCTLGKIENVHSLVRGTMSEALYKRQVQAAPALADDPARAKLFVAAETKFNSEREQGDQVMIGATNCMVATSPAKAYAVLASDHGSDEEAAAMDALFAAAPQCAGKARPKDLSRSFIRAFVADSAWRFANWTPATAQK